METTTLKEIIIQQNTSFKPNRLVSRTKFKQLKEIPQITILTGVRRCGKSTLMQQIRETQPEQDYLLNFDDERLLHFTKDDFQKLYESLIELFGLQKTFYFDEIQNIEYWEYFVRRLHNQGNKIYITGSNANLLSRELGTHLTGRHIQFELFPFSFIEFLDFNNINYSKKDIYSIETKVELKKQFDNYLIKGGFPEFLINNNTEYLKFIYDSILYRDVIARNKLQNELEVRELGYFIAGNIGKPVSYNKLCAIINVKHVNTVKKYLKYLEDTYLVFLLPNFNFSIKKQINNPKKIYFIDNAMARNISFRFSEDRGRFLENTVFLELKRRGHELYYHKLKKECDFLICEKLEITGAIQVTQSLVDQDVMAREISGLTEAMEIHNLKEGLILTENEEFEINKNGKSIKVLPVYKWLLLNALQTT